MGKLTLSYKVILVFLQSLFWTDIIFSNINDRNSGVRISDIIQGVEELCVRDRQRMPTKAGGAL